MGSLDDTHRAIALLAARQDGNATTKQMRDAGLSLRQIRRRVDSGLYIERHTGVFAIGHVPRTRESLIHAAVLAFEDAVSSYESAGALWEVVSGAVRIEVTIPRAAGVADRDGIVVHRQPLPLEHRRTRHGIPVTSLVRTLLDLAAIYRPVRLARVFEEAQVQHNLDPALLAAEVMCRPGHRGTARLRHVLRDAVDPAGVRSILELRFLRMCRQHGLPRPLVNVRIGRWIPDFLWPDPRVIVETDGWNFHRTPAKLRTAAMKDEYLRGLGFTVIRLTWADVVDRPADTAGRVLASLADSLSVAKTTG